MYFVIRAFVEIIKKKKKEGPYIPGSFLYFQSTRPCGNILKRCLKYKEIHKKNCINHTQQLQLRNQSVTLPPSAHFLSNTLNC
jgi:hypothetical protein